jgi:GTP-binding protein
MKARPRIALVGRPNVGKSTLFNRIAGQRKAITDARPGSTRDRNYAKVDWNGVPFELVDTGGLLLGLADPLLGPASKQAERAIAESDVLVLVVDGRAGLLPDDQVIAAQLRKVGRPVVLAVNKTEAPSDLGEFSRLGFAPMVPISAEHGLGVGDLLDVAVSSLPRGEGEGEDEAPPLKVALVGRPNVGKSSLLNRVLGEERALVSEIPGTTRDTVDSLVVHRCVSYLFLDTAGIRKARLLKENVDRVSVVRSRHAIERADVGVLVVDAVEGPREMDATIAGYLQDAGNGVVIAVNKWDLAREKGLKEKATREAILDELKFLAYAPMVFVSARTGLGSSALLSAIQRVAVARRVRVATGPLNRALAKAVALYPPKAARGKDSLRILFATQLRVAPPTFLLSLNKPVDLHFSYKRFLEKQFRKEFGFEGTPLLFKVRTRKH